MCQWLKAQQKRPELAWELRRGNGGRLSVIRNRFMILLITEYGLLFTEILGDGLRSLRARVDGFDD